MKKLYPLLPLIALLLISACSFDIDSEGTFVLFAIGTDTASPPDGVDSGNFEKWDDYDWAKLVVRGGPNGAGEYEQKIEKNLNDNKLSVVFQVKGLQVGYRYSFEIWGYEKNPNANNVSDTIIGKLTDVLISESTNVIRIPPNTRRVAID